MVMDLSDSLKCYGYGSPSADVSAASHLGHLSGLNHQVVGDKDGIELSSSGFSH